MKISVIPFPDDEENIIRMYTKSELAKLYGCGKNYIPGLINRFFDKFKEVGYEKSQKKLTPKQVELLVSLIGGW